MELSKEQKQAAKSLTDLYMILDEEELENFLWDLLTCAFGSKNIKDWHAERRGFTVFRTRLLLDFFKDFYSLEDQIKALLKQS